MHPSPNRQANGRSTLCLLFLCLTAVLLAACRPISLPTGAPAAPAAAATQATAVTVTITADGTTQILTTSAATVREALAEAGVSVAESDDVTPPLFTPLSDGLTISVVRVTESVENTLEAVPFQRKIVRNDTLPADAAPVIVQAGKDGLQEVTVRIVFRDGLEAERWETGARLLEAAQDEIVMIGSGAPQGTLTFAGSLAYIGASGAVLLRGSSTDALPVDTGGTLDGRVFALSPAGDYLLYTRADPDADSFGNSLWVTATQPGADPLALGVTNVLWAGWDPSDPAALRIAYTTAEPTNLPPGWEANNDLWVGSLPPDSTTPFTAVPLVDTYPATYGWWGGNYAWSPDGSRIATSYANEIGLIDIAPPHGRTLLATFPEFNTLSDWVWVPHLSWSPDGRYLITATHGGDPGDATRFDSQTIDTQTGAALSLKPQVGMWGHAYRSPGTAVSPPDSAIAYLQANDPLKSRTSRYTLWLMDADGSNGRQIYPPAGETSYFSNDAQALVWGPDGRDIAFIFDDVLHLYNLERGLAFPLTPEGRASHPTWAPYGAAAAGFLPATRFEAQP